MAVITSIEIQQKNKNRVSLFLDGEFAVGLDGAAAIRAGLRVGRHIEREELDSLVHMSECALAFEKAAKYLGLRLVSRKKMTDYLLDKGFSGLVVEETIARLCELGYINDLAFALAFVRSSGQSSGNNLLRHKLRGFGITGDIIDDAIRQAKPDGEGEAADRVAEKYLRTHAADKRKLCAYLSGRGFSYDSARAAADRALSQASGDDEDN